MTIANRKSNVMLYLDLSLIDKLKERGVNISELVNNYLYNYVAPEENINEILIKANRLEIEAETLRQEAAKKQVEKERIAAEQQKHLEEMGGLLGNKKVVERLKIVAAKPELIEANIRAIQNLTGVELTKEEIMELTKKA